MSGPAYVALETGLILEGRAQSPGTATGEIVFTTAYTGYEESMTDPSYAQQILTFSYPLIGNYGVRADRFESSSIQPEAVIAREFDAPVADWCRDEGVPAIDQLDTRDLVLTVREHGAMACGIAAGPDATPADAERARDAHTPMTDQEDIGATVSTDTPTVYNAEQHDPAATVAVVDCGVKQSIIEAFVQRDAVVHRLPYDTTPSEITTIDPDVVFISNGPGDPENFTNALAVAGSVLGDRPLAGICLGQQIIALAAGGATEKMLFGHRGVNQPVFDRRSEQVIMTTQNHSYAVADPGSLQVTQHNVNDKSAEALTSPTAPVLTRQYHPEANPGPHDAVSFFDDVLSIGAPVEPTRHSAQ